MAYNKETDVYQNALGYVNVKNGNYGASDKVIFAALVDGEMKKWSRDLKGGRRDEDAVRQAARQAALVVQQRIAGESWRYTDYVWAFCSRVGVWCVVEPKYVPKRKQGAKDFPGVCGRFMSKNQGRWTEFWYCNRPSVDGGHCSICAGALKRVEAKEAERRAEIEEQIEERNRLKKLQDDLDELWKTAADIVGIDPERAGDAEITKKFSNKMVARVDDEALMTILRHLVERE